MSTHSSSIVDENVVWFKYYLRTLRGNSRELSIPLFYCTSASILYLHIAYILKHRWFIPLGKLILEDFIAIQNCYSLLWPRRYVLLYNGFQRHWRLYSWANCLRSITNFFRKLVSLVIHVISAVLKILFCWHYGLSLILAQKKCEK